jgi:hypothetical protein
MSETPGATEEPHTTLEGAPETTDRREMLAAALDAAETAPSSEDEPAAPVEPAEPVPASETPETPAEPATPEPWAAPPSSWKKEQHAVYESLAPEAKQYITQRETEMRQGIEPLIPKAKFADEVNQAMQPFQANIQAAGVPPVAAIQTLMQADNILRNAPMEQKRAYALQLLQQYGVDLGDGSYVAPEPVNPQVQALQQQVAQLGGTVQTWQQQQQAQETARLQAEIEAFAADHPHFEKVRGTMSKLMTAEVALTLEDAYKIATRSDETIFSEIQTASQKQAEADRKAAADKAAKAAKAAAVSTRSSTPGHAPPANAKDRRSTLESAFDGLSERF